MGEDGRSVLARMLVQTDVGSIVLVDDRPYNVSANPSAPAQIFNRLFRRHPPLFHSLADLTNAPALLLTKGRSS